MNFTEGNINYARVADTDRILVTGRTSVEKLTDRLLLLHLIEDAAKHGKLGKTKVQKLVFLAELRMLDERRKGFNYNFIRLLYGPFSQSLESDISSLHKSGILAKTVGAIEATELGKMILDDFRDMFRRNMAFTETIRETNRSHADQPLDAIVDYIYSLPRPLKGKPSSIGRLLLRTPLLRRMRPEKATQVFEITPEEIATLEIYMDPDALVSLIRSTQSAKEKRLLSFDEVF